MKIKRFLCLCILILIVSSCLVAGRRSLLLNENWKFNFTHQPASDVTLPHTWNTVDALVGNVDYKRGIGNYRKKLFIRPEWKGKRLFIRFEGANTITNFFVNNKHLGEHRGGYGAFIYEITNSVEYGKENDILVRVNNAEMLDVIPLVGDFNFYGGIYRDVHLLITDEVCISPLDYASSGVYLTQESVNEKRAEVNAKVILSNESGQNKSLTLKIRLLDEKELVIEKRKEVTLASNTQSFEDLSLLIQRPRLWSGKEDPFMYKVEVMLIDADGREIDKVSQPLGLRYYHIDPEKGFFLNSKRLKLHGVCRHQDRSELGNALHKQHHDEDVDIMNEMGVNAARLAHYPQAEYMYDLMDKNGYVVWAEIPFVGPGGYEDKGYVDMQSFRNNAKEQLIEMIRQHYNHPSICFWGLFNELKEYGDNPVEFVKELNMLAHKEDSVRPTVSASNQDGNLNLITDAIAWNKYQGWYGGMPKDLGIWLDETHTAYPHLKIAISEYGAGASIYHQQDSLVKTIPTGHWHPENWQTFYHIENWKEIDRRDFVWGSFVWNMFDFGAAHRTEGDVKGRNDKGLVTFDRQVKKDAYYFYKANWNAEDKMIYLAERRNDIRRRNVTDIMAFANTKEVELFVNGQSQGVNFPDNYAIVLWKNIKLSEGDNHIEIRSKNQKTKLSDHCIWKLIAVE